MPKPLEDLIRADIAANGPMSIARYMALCLSHPQYGYYTTRDPLGSEGDFTTAPEISPLFGEMIGSWLVHAWEAMGAPQNVTLLECGPGRGTLMADILRVAKLRPGFLTAMRLTLSEASPVLIEQQKQLLKEFSPTYIETVADIEDAPLLFIMNEFFDALPIRQYAKAGPNWHERVIGLGPDGLTFGFVPAAYKGEGEFAEVSDATAAIWSVICDKISRHGGAGLVIDYGDLDRASGNTLQAVRNHQKVDPLAEPGEADLTAYVDFALLHSIASENGLAAPVTTQGAFLQALGIGLRAEQVIKARPDLAPATWDAVKRLTAPAQMGDLFKVLGVWQDKALTLPGFPS